MQPHEHEAAQRSEITGAVARGGLVAARRLVARQQPTDLRGNGGGVLDQFRARLEHQRAVERVGVARVIARLPAGRDVRQDVVHLERAARVGGQVGQLRVGARQVDLEASGFVHVGEEADARPAAARN